MPTNETDRTDLRPHILISTGNHPKEYVEAIERNGGIAHAGYLPPYDAACDGLLLAGGCDVEPSRYGQEKNGARACDPERDECEKELIRLFAEAGKPIFGICRGIQILNVCCGGTLIQDLPPMPEHNVPGKTIYHGVVSEPGSLMEALYGNEFPVNSFHHEAVCRAADGFIVTLRSAEDGVVEAMEHVSRPWFAVQFHPERMINGDPFAADGNLLFRHFVSLCRKKDPSAPENP